MIKIEETVIVEGKYDKMRLKPLIDATIIETNGFRIFKDKEKLNLIKQLADKNGILVLTDSDGAGFVIRNFLKGVVPSEKIKHAYIPQVLGKEKRKKESSKEGMLGVEGQTEEIILNAIKNATSASICDKKSDKHITKQDLFSLGLSGRENSRAMRIKLLNKLNLPTYMTTNALVDTLNALMSFEELEKTLDELQ
ncbi:MAG TPA: DUF4093 domain-containing protein [Clostridiales bacterium]|nr:DUF4093 domain-containing protein [Clostridiales bacterium]